ncbi:hypothetical protein [Leuconostoc mesenteroides]|uniref:hypothetical protein n=1 Tax=Leuconostoc mesenteroides TaxID=1245 RepID=UPI0023607DA8|nr:hypothetical protein [Leuconostoc mesenteroides]
MIDKSNVIKLFIPYPTISDDLAKVRHMYVVESLQYTLFNIQTAKPNLVRQKVINNFVVLEPGKETPVRRRSYVGMDVRLILNGVIISDQAKTAVGLSKEIFDDIVQHSLNVKKNKNISTAELLLLNDTVNPI